MKTRILITGSSHVAAVRLGWDLFCQRSTPPVDVDFFAAPVAAFKEFRRKRDGRFGLSVSAARASLNKRQLHVVREVNGSLFRNLSEFSHSVVIGQRSGVESMLVMVEYMGVDGIRTAPNNGVTLSQPAFDQFCRYFAEQKLPYDLRDRLSGTEVGIFTLPLRAEGGDDDGEGRIQIRKQHPDGLKDLIARYFEVAAEVYAAQDLQLLAQPMETITPYGTTDLRYNRGSEHLDAAKVHDDPTHMNGPYGLLCIERILSWAKTSDFAVAV